ncbi:MAG: [protein-PII] uridylyltransferase [Caulobacterales bacterium]|nr:[protein-PII] uridylyltransferase [Caulobacterales bacterium]
MARRLKPTRLEHVVDGVALRARLTAAALDALRDPAEQRRRALEILRQALFRGRMIVKERLENGAGGIETARLLSGVTDEVVTALYDFTTVHMIRARNPTEGERLGVVAVGGYGRGALAPYSDLDLLFLRPYKQTAHVESVIEFMLYALWDLGFKVGHASRTVEECIKLSREDFTIRTSILEARRLTGDERLFDELQRRFRAEVVKGTEVAFVTAKLKERDERQTRAGASRYMVEPNVKEGKGGLRDLHTLMWIAEYLHAVDRPDDVFQLDMFERRETKTFIRAFDFLHAVRAHLHFTTGRAEERLTFDLQPEIARRMGYGDRGDAPAVERFMRFYFLVAKDVGALTRTFAAKLEAEQLKKQPKGISRFLPGKSRRMKPIEAEGFFEDGGRLNVDGAWVFERDPVDLIRIFKIADQRGLDLHPDAFTAITRSLGLITSRVRRDPDASRAFLDVLARGKETYRVLTLMNESGVLGRFLPEFGRVVAQMQFNMYHSYTVDEHTLRAVGVIGDIIAGRLDEEHPLSASVMPLIGDRETLFLAMLLHDTGKGGVGGQEKAGARSARSACERLGVERTKVELVAWLVEHHLVMSDYAQKRDVADPRTIESFAHIVENPERMRLLLVLTVADIRAVGPGVWNGWKGQLLRELYTATEAVFRGGRGSDAAASVMRAHERHAAEARAQLIAADASTADWAGAMENAYFVGFQPAELTAHAALARRAVAEGGVAAEAFIPPGSPAAEIVVAARDRRGLFADLTLAISALGGNVMGARVFTSRQGEALDVFYVQDGAGMPLGGDNPRQLARMAEAVAAAGRGETVTAERRRTSDMGRAAAFKIAPAVTLDNDASREATVVEASGRDWPGLLEALARTLAEAGLSIQSAHVDGYGERAVDTFYVQTADGAKVTDTRKMNSLKTALLAAMDRDSPNLKPRLQRATASVAR